MFRIAAEKGNVAEAFLSAASGGEIDELPSDLASLVTAAFEDMPEALHEEFLKVTPVPELYDGWLNEAARRVGLFALANEREGLLALLCEAKPNHPDLAALRRLKAGLPLTSEPILVWSAGDRERVARWLRDRWRVCRASDQQERERLLHWLSLRLPFSTTEPDPLLRLARGLPVSSSDLAAAVSNGAVPESLWAKVEAAVMTDWRSVGKTVRGSARSWEPMIRRWSAARRFVVMHDATRPPAKVDLIELDPEAMEAVVASWIEDPLPGFAQLAASILWNSAAADERNRDRRCVLAPCFYIERGQGTNWDLSREQQRVLRFFEANGAAPVAYPTISEYRRIGPSDEGHQPQPESYPPSIRPLVPVPPKILFGSIWKNSMFLALAAVLGAILVASLVRKHYSLEMQYDGVRFEFVEVPPGQFNMGAPPDDPASSPDERPRHLITIRIGFQMGRFEIDQTQWQVVMGNNPSSFEDPRTPVTQVSWADARQFIGKLNRRNDGFWYRLPTEAEWEYAATAGSFDRPAAELENIAWYLKNSPNGPARVGAKAANAWGLFDMLGNVSEWCDDWYSADFYRTLPGDESGPPRTSDANHYRVRRGGSWRSEAEGLRFSKRGFLGQTQSDDQTGFRLARQRR